MTTSAKDQTEGLWFSIKIKDEEFVAFISADALTAHFNAIGMQGQALLSAYTRHQQVIDAMAQRKFFGGTPRPVKLTSADF